MSRLNTVDNCHLPKPENEVVNNSDHNVNNEDMSNEYILSLLNNSSDSDKTHHSLTESVLNNSTESKDENASIPNSPKISLSNSIHSVSDNQTNISKENTGHALSDVKQFDVETNISSKNENELKVTERQEYRDSDSPWTEDEDSSSSSSSDSDFHFESIPRCSSPKADSVKTKGELGLEDLPPIEYLKISVDEQDLKKVGKVHAIVLKLVVIQASKDEKPLDIDSVLFLAPNEPLGRIFEVFGPVVEPFYTVLFNSPEDIGEKGVQVGSEVFFAPHKNEITSYVFVDALRQQKGSDASWKDNNEPPEEHLDYSDDEQERAARMRRRGKNRVRESEDDDEEVQIIPYKISPNEKRTFNYTSYTRNNSCETWNIRNSVQNNRNSIQNNGNNLDNVPVWITEPPPYLKPKPLPSQSSNSSTPPVQSFHLKQPSSLPVQNQVQPLNSSNSSQTQFRSGGPLLLNPKQPFVPRQPPNLNSQRPLFHPQSRGPPNGNAHYFPSLQRPPPQQMQQQPNGHARFFPSPQRPPQPVMFQNMNQHVFGQITPVGVMSPAPPMSPAMFSPCPSPNLYVSPLPSPALSPNPFWRPPNQHAVSFNNVGMSQPPTTPLTIQIPVFSSPSPVSFSAANNSSVPPPPLYNNFSTPPPYQYSARF